MSSEPEIELSVVSLRESCQTRVRVTVTIAGQDFIDTLNVASDTSRRRFLTRACEQLSCDRSELESALLEVAAQLAEESEIQRSDGAPIDSHRLADTILAARFTQDGVPTLAFWHEEFYVWRRTHWSPLSNGQVEAEVARILADEFNNLAQNGVTDSGGHRFNVTRQLTTNVLLAIRSRVLIDNNVELPAWIDREDDVRPDPQMLLTCTNGIVDLTEASAELQLPTPALFNLNGVDYGFDANADCPQWRAFLEEIWPDDVQAKQALQEYMGHCLIPLTRFQKILCMIGPPRSGKGTITGVLTALVGRGNVCSPMIGSLTGDFGLQPLLGKLVAIFNDARIPRRGQERLIESLLMISGEDSVTVNRKGLAQINARLATRFVIVSNELPEFRDSACALPNRLLLLRFNRSWTGEEDTTLTERLLAELPGILNFAIEGLRRLLERNRFEQPDSSHDLMESLLQLSSPTRSFVEALCNVGPNLQVAKADLFGAYQQWCSAHNIHCPQNSVFGRNLHSVIPELSSSQPRQRRSPEADETPIQGSGPAASRRPPTQRRECYEGVTLRSNWRDCLPR